MSSLSTSSTTANLSQTRSPAEKSPYSSVKLPTELVDQARQSAAVFRRSVAGQIEYWAALGQSMERSNLTVREAHQVLDGAENAATSALTRDTHPDSTPNSTPNTNPSLAAIKARMLQSGKNGSLAVAVRQTVAANKTRRVKAAA
jgi:hypothetical protein